MEIKPMNEYLLVKIEDEKKGGVYLGEDNAKPKIAEILAFSDKCENKNLEVGKKVYLRKYEMIPNNDTADEFFVSEKAVIGMF
jgi:co-chaperonin GroES (HSP10)